MKLRHLLVATFVCMVSSLFAQTHEQGIEYYKADQYNNAYELLTRNLNNPGTDKALSYYYLGMIDLYRKNNAEAEKYFKDGLALDPNCAYNYVGLGYMALKNNDLKTAEKYFKDAESKGKKDQSVMMAIARAYYDADPVLYKQKYDKLITNALKKGQNNPDVYILQGDIYRDEANATGDSKLYGKAAAQYDMATSFDPTSSVAYVKYASMYNHAKNPPYAIAKLQELLKNNPSSALGQRELAILYYDTDQFDKASQQYGEYVQNPNHFKSDEVRYAVLLYYAGDYQKGFDYATSLLAQDPDNFTARRFQFLNAAKLPSQAYNIGQIADDLMAAHKANENNTMALIDYNNLIEQYNNIDRRGDAENVLIEAIEVFPAQVDLLKNLSEMYIDDGAYGLATDAYQQYVEKKEDSDYVDYATLALFAMSSGLQEQSGYMNNLTKQIFEPNDDNAKKYYDLANASANKAAELHPTWYKPHKILGDIAMITATPDKQYTAAAPEYIKAIELLEANPDPNYNKDAYAIYAYLANYYNGKDAAKAKEYTEKANAIQQ